MQLKIIVFVVLALALLIVGSSIHQRVTDPQGRDDWAYNPQKDFDEGRVYSAPSQALTNTAPMAGMAAEDNLGFSVGGAKDIENFRQNIENGFLPLPTDITYEGLIYSYYFDTGMQQSCNALFCPSYAYAVAKDPLSGEAQYYLTVGLNSGLKESDFQRKKLNLVIVLDISGSMSSSFDRYYYDQFGNAHEVGNIEDQNKTKLQVATAAIVDLLDHLTADDRLGVVLFDDQAYLGKGFSMVGDTDMARLKGHILELQPAGGTNMSAGMQMGTELFKELQGVNPDEYENRIIFLTDAMPNTGETSEQGLLGMAKRNAQAGIYGTFIGIGVDFNTELVESITKIRGANYYSVHSAAEFKERMDDGFSYMVTPLVFNLRLNLEAAGFEIEKVYGSPEADLATGTLMQVNTLFPSKTQDGQTKGGVVLLKLKRIGEGAFVHLKLSAVYEDRNGSPGASEADVTFGDQAPDFYQNSGVRKAVLLARYSEFLKNWTVDERVSQEKGAPVEPTMSAESGIVVVQDVQLGQWERQSLPLHVMPAYKEMFQSLQGYFETEMAQCDDETLKQELELLNTLIAHGS